MAVGRVPWQGGLGGRHGRAGGGGPGGAPARGGGGGATARTRPVPDGSTTRGRCRREGRLSCGRRASPRGQDSRAERAIHASGRRPPGRRARGADERTVTVPGET